MDGDDPLDTSSFILPELTGKSDILEHNHVENLSRFLPARAEGYSWSLSFTTSTMGFSLKSLYRSLAKYDGPVLLIIKDTEQVVFGAFCSCNLQPSETFYGTGETYLFTFKPPEPKSQSQMKQQQSKLKQSNNLLPSSNEYSSEHVDDVEQMLLPPLPSTSSPEELELWLEHKQQLQKKQQPLNGNKVLDYQNQTIEDQSSFKRFPWTGDNLYFIKGNQDSIVFGAGEGTFGLWLDGDLYHGSTHPCKTFNNEQLTHNEDFVVSALECWCFYISN